MVLAVTSSFRLVLSTDHVFEHFAFKQVKSGVERIGPHTHISFPFSLTPGSLVKFFVGFQTLRFLEGGSLPPA